MISPDFLEEALSGRLTPGPSHAPLRALVGVAVRLRRLPIAGPEPDASRRLAKRFERTLEGGHGSWRAWFAAPLSGRQRLVQRFAAAVLLTGAAGTTAGAVAGVTPFEAAAKVGSVMRSLVASLDPSGGSPADPVVSPSETATPSAGPGTTTASASSPAGTPTAGGSPPAASAPGGTSDPTPSPGTAPSPSETPLPGGTQLPGVGATPSAPSAPGPSATAGATPTPTSARTGRDGPPTLPSGASTPIGAPSPTATSARGTATPPQPTATATVTATRTATPPPSMTPTPGPGVVTYSAGAAGSVTVRIGPSRVDFVSVSTNPGWSAEAAEPTSTGFKLKFGGASGEVEFEAGLDSDGRVWTSVKSRDDEPSPEAEDR